MNKAFITTLVGSLPRSKELLGLKQKSLLNPDYVPKYLNLLYKETENAIKMQERVGLDIIVSGELNRDNYMSYVAEHVLGVKLMSMKEIMEITNNNAEFSESLEEMDAADDTMNSPVCVGKINTDSDFNSEEIKMLKKISDKTFKVTLPSPYLLTRSMWLKEKSSAYYSDRKELGKDVVELLKNEIKRLADLGASVIQLDEPILSEVVFTKAKGDTSFY